MNVFAVMSRISCCKIALTRNKRFYTIAQLLLPTIYERIIQILLRSQHFLPTDYHCHVKAMEAIGTCFQRTRVLADMLGTGIGRQHCCFPIRTITLLSQHFGRRYSMSHERNFANRYGQSPNLKRQWPFNMEVGQCCAHSVHIQHVPLECPLRRKAWPEHRRRCQMKDINLMHDTNDFVCCNSANLYQMQCPCLQMSILRIS